MRWALLRSVAGPVPQEASCAGGAWGDDVVMAYGNVDAAAAAVACQETARNGRPANAALTVSIGARLQRPPMASGRLREIQVRSR